MDLGRDRVTPQNLADRRVAALAFGEVLEILEAGLTIGVVPAPLLGGDPPDPPPSRDGIRAALEGGGAPERGLAFDRAGALHIWTGGMVRSNESTIGSIRDPVRVDDLDDVLD